VRGAALGVGTTCEEIKRMRAVVLLIPFGLLSLVVARAEPNILHGPVLESITYTSARVTWITDIPSSTEIRFGLTTAYDGLNTGLDKLTTHSWYISGLAPGTTYHYQVCSAAGGTTTCSQDASFTTEARASTTPFPPEPPRKKVDVSMPAGDYGEPFVVTPDCSNLRSVFTELARLSGDLNYEIRIPAATECRGQFVFPSRPAHNGWVVVRSDQSDTLPYGIRLPANAAPQLASFITDAAPATLNVLPNMGTSCVADTLWWAVSTPGMALFVCNGGPAGWTSPQPISGVSWSGTGPVMLNVPGHGYRSGSVIRVTGATAFTNSVWRITVTDDDHFILDGARGGGTYSGGGTVSRNEAWVQVPHTSGTVLPESCRSNEFFFRTDVQPTSEAVYWCTSPDKWTNIRMINTSTAENYSAVQFQPNAAKYRFIGIEVTHIPMPQEPPRGWSAPRFYGQGTIGSLVTTRETNSHIIFDRCDIHGLDYPSRLAIAVNLDGSDVAIVDSRIHKVNRWAETRDGTNLETTAILVPFGPGPGRIENNLLEAIGITVFFPEGGTDAYHRSPAADYEISRNYFSHPIKYLEQSTANESRKSYMNRHHFELKRGRRMLLEGNVFDVNWSDVNQGAFVMLTPRPGSVPAAKKISGIEDGVLTLPSAGDPYRSGMWVYVRGTDRGAFDGIWQVDSRPAPNQVKLAGMPSGSAGASGTVVAVASDIQISDIDFRNNIFRYGPNVLWITGHQDGAGGTLNTKTTQRIRFENNLVYGLDTSMVSPSSPYSSRAGTLAFAARGMEDLIIRNNTIASFKASPPTLLFMDSIKYGAHAGLDVSDNIFLANGALASQISGSLYGDRALDQQWMAHPKPSWNFSRNVLCCTNPGVGKLLNSITAPNMWIDKDTDIRFVDPSTGNFRLSTESPFKLGQFCFPGLLGCPPPTGVDPGVDMDLLEHHLSPDNPPITPQ
jgi:hypothetical protein